MTSEQKNKMSDYGVSNNTGSFMEWLRGENGIWLAGSMWGEKTAPLFLLSGEEQTFFLTPAVAACYFKNTLTIPFQCIEMENCTTPGGQPLYQIPNRRRLLFKRHFFFFFFFATCDLTHCNSWQTINAIQYRRWKQEHSHVRRMEESSLKNVKIFFAICWTVWEVSNSMSFYLYRHWWMLFWPGLWPLLCQLCRQFPVPLS